MLFAIDKWLILAIFVLIWLNDSGAYLVGSMTAKLPGGNHKMFPRVSPKKSWEGLIGGIVLSIGAGILLAYFGWFDLLAEKMNVYVIGAIFALVVSVFGTIGDLVESLMKRTIGVKDSGRFLPGHGGILDRFDSILLAAPMALILITILLTW
jgi:phosphatidate cytidylyltransferase